MDIPSQWQCTGCKVVVEGFPGPETCQRHLHGFFERISPKADAGNGDTLLGERHPMPEER